MVTQLGTVPCCGDMAGDTPAVLGHMGGHVTHCGDTKGHTTVSPVSLQVTVPNAMSFCPQSWLSLLPFQCPPVSV